MIKAYVKFNKTVTTNIFDIYIPLLTVYGRIYDTYYYVLPSDIRTAGKMVVYILDKKHKRFNRLLLSGGNKIVKRVQEYYALNEGEIEHYLKTYSDCQGILHYKQEGINRRRERRENGCAYKPSIGVCNPPNGRIYTHAAR